MTRVASSNPARVIHLLALSFHEEESMSTVLLPKVERKEKEIIGKNMEAT